MNTIAAFSVDHLTYRTPRGKILLNDITVDIPAQCLCVLIGANGAGKSTLLRHFSGHLTKQTGKLYHFGRDVTEMSVRDRALSMAWVGQHPQNDCPLTVEEFVLLGRRVHLGHFRVPSQADRELAYDAMRTLEIEHFAARRYRVLSGGERQRAVIAQAFTQQSPTLLLDEPTNHLDLRHRHLLMQTLAARVQLGHTVVAVLHDLDLAARYSDWVVLLDQGRVLAAGTPTNVLTSENLSQAYQWPIQVQYAPDGEIMGLQAA